MPRTLASLSALAVLSAPVIAWAADAHVGIQPNHGEMVLLRDVSARPAYRPAPPGIALIVDPTPNKEVNGVLGTGEMTDDDFAAMSGGPVTPAGAGVTLPQRITDSALQGSLGRIAGDNSALAGGSLGSSIGGATGAVTSATRGIAPTITGALSQFPLGGGQGTGP